MERLVDDQGHEWPVTGYYCLACGMPLHPVLRDIGVHVNCAVPRSPAVPEEQGTPTQEGPA
jgi:hypothetical protein